MRKRILRQFIFGSEGAVIGQAEYTTPGSYSWECPAGVTSVCAVCVGGGTLRAGGGLGYKNDISVTPGVEYDVVVGGASQDSYFVNTSTVVGEGGTLTTGGGYVGDGGGNGGDSPGSGSDAGAGAGGYSGDGGDSTSGDGNAGAGGGGGGGRTEGFTGDDGGGGGVGIYGQGASGAGGVDGSEGGKGGSGGADGTISGNGGLYGGGSANDGTPATGAVRIIWGPGRAFPSTNTQDM